MKLITESWDNVLTYHLNKRYNVQLNAADLEFTKNKFYPQTDTRRYMDVHPKNDKLSDSSMFYFKPYNPTEYFWGIPVIVRGAGQTTGEGIIDYLSTKFGINFDKNIDIEPDFLTTVFPANAKAQEVVITMAATSAIWAGSFTIVLVDDAYDLSALTNRQLDALVYPDVTKPNTVSLRLITTPCVVKSPELSIALCATPEVILTPELARDLASEYIEDFLFPEEWRTEFVAMMSGQKLVFTDVEGIAEYSRVGTTETALFSEHMSGFICVKVKRVSDTSIGRAIGSPLALNELITGGYNDKQAILNFSANAATANDLTGLLGPQRTLHPNLVRIPEVISAIGKGTVKFAEATVTSSIDAGVGGITQAMDPKSSWTGEFAVTCPIERFVVSDELGSVLSVETGAEPIQMEKRVVTFTKGTGPINTDLSWVDSVSYDDLLYVGRILFDGRNADNTLKLSPATVKEDVKDGAKYTNTVIPGVTIYVKGK